tara:strand:- start:56 stop:409 length:354 start_codon:yes stop_codon:yes gene_type:complete
MGKNDGLSWLSRVVGDVFDGVQAGTTNRFLKKAEKEIARLDESYKTNPDPQRDRLKVIREQELLVNRYKKGNKANKVEKDVKLARKVDRLNPWKFVEYCREHKLLWFKEGTKEKRFR